jgi:plasmid stabilization system protein ParE
VKKRKVTLSSQARAYVSTEARYLRQRSHSGAEKFLSLMRLARADLTDFPKMGLGKDGLPHGDLRLYFAGPYILDYPIRGDEVLVVSIRHGRQQDPTLPLDEITDQEDDDAP